MSSPQIAPWSAGPWFFEEAETRKRQYLVRCQAGRNNGGRGMAVADKIELDHDARLIAAAPELYEALEWALNELHGRNRYDEDAEDDQTDACYARAETALVKARGDQ